MSRGGGVRVVAGRFRGFRVETCQGLGVRPTADRVKEALFSILDPRLPDSVVVDCFAGTGSLGIEALSRGASQVTFVENDRESLAVLRGNLERLPEPRNWSVIQGDGLQPAQWRATGLPADLILADPPYRKGMGEELLQKLDEAASLRREGLLVLEHEKNTEPEHPRWEVVDRRRYGDTALSFYRWNPGGKENPDANRDLSGDV